MAPDDGHREHRCCPNTFLENCRWKCDDVGVDEFTVQCPYCGEDVPIYVEPDVRGTFVQDCEVCCNPWRVHVSGRGDERLIEVTRGDGSE